MSGFIPLSPEEEFEARVARHEMDAEAKAEASRRIAERRHAQLDRMSRLTPGGDFGLDEPETIPAVWGKGELVLWAEGEGLMILAEQGLGKTTIAQQLTLSMIGVRADALLGLTVKQATGPVLYLAMDRPRQAARSLSRMIGEADRTALNERLVVWRGPLPLDITASPQALADWAQEVAPGCSVIVADSVKDFAPGLAKDEVGAALNLAWQEVIARGIDLLLLHHPRKDSEGKPSLNAAYGSTWLTAGLGSVIQLTGARGAAEVKLHHVKQPSEIVGPWVVEHDYASGTSVRGIGSVEDYLLLKFTDPSPQTVQTVAEGMGMSEKSARARLEKLVEAGKVIKTEPVQTADGRSPAVYTLRVA
ncbi:AAA family ATPase [Microbacterium sp. TNHR37B]|uniref:AAA family ATPase n=1 Tax=Microbacterium sp. TNHR37B TaxID=1775956 RepID=UPI0012FA5E12|nr:AAA family ATPase [Microbacterium sp. TNHR37B]